MHVWAPTYEFQCVIVVHGMGLPNERQPLHYQIIGSNVHGIAQAEESTARAKHERKIFHVTQQH